MVPDDTMPADPVTNLEAHAVKLHHQLETYMSAGFTRAESFQLTTANYEAWCNAEYTHSAETHCPVCNGNG